MILAFHTGLGFFTKWIGKYMRVVLRSVVVLFLLSTISQGLGTQFAFASDSSGTESTANIGGVNADVEINGQEDFAAILEREGIPNNRGFLLPFSDDLWAPLFLLLESDAVAMLHLRGVCHWILRVVTNLFQQHSQWASFPRVFWIQNWRRNDLPMSRERVIELVAENTNRIFSDPDLITSGQRIGALNRVHRQMLVNSGLLDSLPRFEDPFLMLANVFMELRAWQQVQEQVGNLIRFSVEAQTPIVGPRVFDLVGGQEGRLVGDRIVRDPVQEVLNQIPQQVGGHARNEIESHIGRVRVDAMDQEVESDYRRGLYPRTIFNGGTSPDGRRLSIHHAFLVNQVVSIVSRHSPEMAEIREKLADYLRENLMEERVKEILRGITLRGNEDPLIKTQLDLLRRSLPK